VDRDRALPTIRLNMFARLKDRRSIHVRDDRCAHTFMPLMSLDWSRPASILGSSWGTVALIRLTAKGQRLVGQIFGALTT
jgi:hypothetical protein